MPIEVKQTPAKPALQAAGVLTSVGGLSPPMKKPPGKEPQKPPRNRKSRAGKSLKKVNLEKLHKQLLNILRRDVEELLVSSRKPPLKPEQTEKLLLYLKQVKTLRKDELDELNGLSDEELEALAAKGKKL